MLGLALHLAGSDLIINDTLLEDLIQQKYPRLNLTDFEQKMGVNEIPVLKVVQQLLKLDENQNLDIKLSNCNLPILQDEICCPLPGESILAKVTRKGDLELHSLHCNKNKTIGLDKLIPVIILNDTETPFLAKLIITIHNQPGVFSKLSSIIAERQINMEEIFQERHDNHALVIVRLTISVNSNKEVEDLLTTVAENDFVLKAMRA